MSTSDDDTQRHGLTLLIILIVLVLIGVVSLGVSKALSPRAGSNPAQAPVPQPTVFKMYFEPGSAALPGNAQDVLGPVADQARSRAHATVWLSGFHDATGDAQANAELAKNRALAVQHGLEANGVSIRAIELNKPQLAPRSTEAKEARRVDISVR
ncbi:MAG: OmpA family protein [Pseudomonadota bacterium]